MSGGSLNYLYNRDPDELFNHVKDLEEVEYELLRRSYTDIARDVRRLIEYIQTAENRISVLAENLSGVFHAVEWRLSADYGEDTLREHLEAYREGKG